MSQHLRRVGLSLTLLCVGLAGCAGSSWRPFTAEPLQVDPDRRPFKGEPEEYFSPFAWDGANQTIFRPISQAFAVDPAGEALNVNSLDEVADSSWFTNRLGRYAMTPEQVKQGPCSAPPADPSEVWTVTGAKPNGANPGFLIKTASGSRYLLKFDGDVQGPRATAADVVGSRIYHAAGYFVPCNRIVHFDRKILRIDPEASSENAQGDKVKLEFHHIEKVLEKGLRLPDGRYRANSSLFIDGKPIGPWTYEETRPDDPNDVIPHQERRDLRGMRVLAAWTNHFDSREQNTLAAWVKTQGEWGYVRHYMIDFCDCFGSIWEPPMMGRRIGHSNYLDFQHLAADFLTLGVIERPWDTARFGPSGSVFAYYDVDSFEPGSWQPGYPNPAFSRMSEWDGAWMARIIAHFGDAHVRAAVVAAEMSQDLTEELTRLLIGRRDKILRRYLGDLSPLGLPRLVQQGGQTEICSEDLALKTRARMPSDRSYYSRAFTQGWRPLGLAKPTAVNGWVCQPVPDVPGRDYVMVDLFADSRSKPEARPLRVHLRRVQGSYQLAGVERL